MLNMPMHPYIASRKSIGTSDEGLNGAKTSKEKRKRRRKKKKTTPIPSCINNKALYKISYLV